MPQTEQAQEQQVVVVLGTGGTISGRAARADDLVSYAAGEVSVADLVSELGLQPGVRLESEQVAQRFAHGPYEASALSHDFRPAFVAIDVDLLFDGEASLMDSLAADARIPGLRVILDQGDDARRPRCGGSVPRGRFATRDGDSVHPL